MHILLSGQKNKLHDHKNKTKKYIYIKTVPIKKVHLYFLIFYFLLILKGSPVYYHNFLPLLFFQNNN